MEFGEILHRCLRGISRQGEIRCENGRVANFGTVPMAQNLAVEGELEVGPTGRVEGERVEARSVLIHGEVKAELTAEKVVLSKTARFTGQLKAQALEVEAGAVFVGQSVAGEHKALEAPKEA